MSDERQISSADSYDEAVRRLKKLASESATFDDFKAKIASFKRWYLGDPVIPELRTWTLPDFQKLFNEVKGIES